METPNLRATLPVFLAKLRNKVVLCRKKATCIKIQMMNNKMVKTRSIQRTQKPPRL